MTYAATLAAPGQARRGVRTVVVRFADWLAARYRRYRVNRTRRRDYRILMALDDRTLRDIGMHRTDAAALAYGEVAVGRHRVRTPA